LAPWLTYLIVQVQLLIRVLVALWNARVRLLKPELATPGLGDGAWLKCLADERRVWPYIGRLGRRTRFSPIKFAHRSALEYLFVQIKNIREGVGLATTRVRSGVLRSSRSTTQLYIWSGATWQIAIS